MHRYSRHGTLVAAVALLALTTAQDGVALAQPPVTPSPPPPVIGPLQYGPPGYPPTIGIALLPAARAGVGISADSLSPAPAPPAGSSPSGIAGVNVTDDSINARNEPH